MAGGPVMTKGASQVEKKNKRAGGPVMVKGSTKKKSDKSIGKKPGAKKPSKPGKGKKRTK